MTGADVTEETMGSIALWPARVAYADPPYEGCAARSYRREVDYDGEVDHEALIARLVSDYDGWALSMKSNSLRRLLPLCPERARVGAWVKPWCSFKPGQTVAYAWEPIVFVPARARPRELPTLRDWIACNATTRTGLPGVKPEAVCRWMFEILGLKREDSFDDLFPGSGAVSGAWRIFCCEAARESRA